MTTILRGTLATGVAATLPEVRSYETDILSMDDLIAFLDCNLPYTTRAGEDVATLIDRSGNSAGFAQGAAVNRPHIVRQALRGKSVVDFASDGTGQYMNWQGTYPVGSSSAHTEVFLFKLDGTPGATAHLFSDNSPFADSHVTFFNTSGQFSHGCGSGFGACVTPAVVGEWAIYWAFYDATFSGNPRAGVQVNDNAPVFVQGTGVPASTTAYLGRSDTGNNGSLDGQLAAMLVFDADLSVSARDDDRAVISAYLRARAGIVV